MEGVKQWLRAEGFELFKEAKKLSEEISKSDPETEPYKSKYKARQIWSTLKSKLDALAKLNGDDCLNFVVMRLREASPDPGNSDVVVFEECASDQQVSNLPAVANTNCCTLSDGSNLSGVVTIRSLLVVLAYELGVNYVECEEIKTGEEYFQSCIQLASAFQGSEMFVSVLIAAHNQLSIVWSNRGMNDNSLKLLKTAEHLYKNAVANSITSPFYFEEAWYVAEDFLSEATRKASFEKLHTLTLYYLAQVYGVLGDLELSGRYCHVTLARQMLAGEYDPMEWSLNCATLSQYYVTRDQFPFARYCLACAEAVNKEAHAKFVPEKHDVSDVDRQQEMLAKSQADVYRCWAKYGLNLLKVSHTIMLQEHGDVASREKERDSGCNEEDLRDLRFGTIDVIALENQVVDKFVRTYHDAKAVFQFSQKCLTKAKEFYKLDGFVSDFVEIVQDISQFYKYLAFFENSFETRCKMHKRRVDMLNDILLRLNPKHFLQICRQLTFEIAEAYAEIADLKKAVIEEGTSKVDASKLKKVNFLLLQSVKYYQAFIDTYKRDGELPASYDEDAVRGVLLAFFCMARVYSKYLSRDKAVKADYMTKERDCYKYLVNYCDRHPKMASIMGEELSISRDMIGLFSVKMSNVLENLD